MNKEILKIYNDILLDAADLISASFRSTNRSASLPLGFLTRELEVGVSSLGLTDREQLLNTLAQTIRSCKQCKLSLERTQAVPGVGVLDPLVMVIGEGPGAEEDRQGLPFVGPAGKYLDKWLEAVGLSREKNTFIANIVKCRPPGNRDPQPGEAETCIPFLWKQVEIVKPKVLFTLGRIAIQHLLQTDRGIGSLRGTIHQWKGIPLLATYHPSAVLRDMNLKRPVWEDLKRLKNFLDQV